MKLISLDITARPAHFAYDTQGLTYYDYDGLDPISAAGPGSGVVTYYTCSVNRLGEAGVGRNPPRWSEGPMGPREGDFRRSCRF